IGAHVLGGAAYRIGVWSGEDLRRHLVAHGLQYRAFLALREPSRREFKALEIAGDSGVLVEKQLLVRFFEIEGKVERAAQPRILELLAARIQGERLHAAGAADRKFLLDNPAVLDGREIIDGRPVLRAVLPP